MPNPVIEETIIPRHLDLFCRVDGRTIIFNFCVILFTYTYDIYMTSHTCMYNVYIYRYYIIYILYIHVCDAIQEKESKFEGYNTSTLYSKCLKFLYK